MGPIVSKRQQERVLGYIEGARQDGARVVAGGGVPAHLTKGYFVEPTLIADVTNDMRVAREEIFGPVIVMIAYEDDDDAVRIANDSDYGLSGGVCGHDEARAISVAKRLRTGTVSVNGGMWFSGLAPFGGYKQSGIGRESGVEGFEEYLESKCIGLRRDAPQAAE
jgi:aldehyde dehydrogenase (NAD+)